MRDPLADVLLAADTDDEARFRVATVSGTSPLEVAMGGETGLSASRLSSYTPTLNDRVLVLQGESDLTILGKLVSGG